MKDSGTRPLPAPKSQDGSADEKTDTQPQLELTSSTSVAPWIGKVVFVKIEVWRGAIIPVPLFNHTLLGHHPVNS